MITLAARIHRVDEVGPCLESGFDHLEISLPCPGGPEEEEYWLALARDKKVSLLGHGPHEGNPRDLLHLEKKLSASPEKRPRPRPGVSVV